jgi:hypothetical protein
MPFTISCPVCRGEPPCETCDNTGEVERPTRAEEDEEGRAKAIPYVFVPGCDGDLTHVCGPGCEGVATKAHCTPDNHPTSVGSPEEPNLVAAVVEECAKIAEKYPDVLDPARRIAAAIRSRGLMWKEAQDMLPGLEKPRALEEMQALLDDPAAFFGESKESDEVREKMDEAHMELRRAAVNAVRYIVEQGMDASADGAAAVKALEKALEKLELEQISQAENA